VRAASAIETAVAGTEMGAATALIVGVDPATFASQKRIKQGQQFCRRTIDRIVSALRLPAPDPERARALAERCREDSRPRVLALTRKLEELLQLSQQLETEQAQVDEAADRQLREAQIRVTGALHPRTMLAVGATKLCVRDALRAVCGALNASSGRIELQALEAGR
jgi:uncharacterized protein (DUF342 family)